jgi:sulfotransferase family protein
MVRDRPDVVHIGYMRAGSTYLRSYFTQHPEIHWTRHAWYFQLESSDEVRNAEYHARVASDTRAPCFLDMYEGLSLGYVLTKTSVRDRAEDEHPEWAAAWALRPGGLMDGSIIVPAPEEIARRIKAAVPQAKILIVLRNQHDWLRSMYLHYTAYYPPGRARFVDFLDTLEGKAAIAAACYDRTLDVYAASFGRERMHVMLLEELNRHEDQALRALCEFLGVAFRPVDHEHADRNQGKRRLPDGRPAVPESRPTLWKRAIARRGPSPAGGTSNGVLTADDQAYVRALCAASNYRTSVWLGRDLAHWGYAL